jgi:hypothetical protein
LADVFEGSVGLIAVPPPELDKDQHADLFKTKLADFGVDLLADGG